MFPRRKPRAPPPIAGPADYDDFGPLAPNCGDGFSGKLLNLGGCIWSECTVMAADVLYIQTNAIFPSWTSRVRVPSPAPSFQQVRTTFNHPSHPVLRLCSVYITCRDFSSRLTAAWRISTEVCV